MNCKVCQQPIPDGRAEFLMENHRPATCLAHSKEQPVKAFPIFDCKTNGAVVIVPNAPDGTNDAEKIRIAKRAYERKR